MANCRRLETFDSVPVEATLGRFEPHTLASPVRLLPTCSLDIVLASALVILIVRTVLCAIVSFMFICNCSLRMRYLLNALKYFKHTKLLLKVTKCAVLMGKHWLLAVASAISIHAGTTYCEDSVFSCLLLPDTVLIPQAKQRSILCGSFAAKKNAAHGEIFQIAPTYTRKLHHVNIID